MSIRILSLYTLLKRGQPHVDQRILRWHFVAFSLTNEILPLRLIAILRHASQRNRLHLDVAITLKRLETVDCNTNKEVNMYYGYQLT